MRNRSYYSVQICVKSASQPASRGRTWSESYSTHMSLASWMRMGLPLPCGQGSEEAAAGALAGVGEERQRCSLPAVRSATCLHARAQPRAAAVPPPALHSATAAPASKQQPHVWLPTHALHRTLAESSLPFQTLVRPLYSYRRSLWEMRRALGQRVESGMMPWIATTRGEAVFSSAHHQTRSAEAAHDRERNSKLPKAAIPQSCCLPPHRNARTVST